MSLRVLIIEDDATIAASIAAGLLHAGHEAQCVATGEEALSAPPADVVIADVGLPGIDGLEAIERLQARGDSPRTIILSGLPDLSACRRALHLGADEFLTKPVPVERVILAALEPKKAQNTPTTLDRTFDVESQPTEAVAREVAAFAMQAGISPAGRARIAGVAAELIDNVAEHAYPFASGEVRIEATYDRRSFELKISDQGVGFDPLAEGLDSWTDCRAGGLARAAALSEDLVVDATPGHGARVQVRFDITRALFDEEEQVDLSELDWLPPAVTRQVLETCAESPEGASRFVLSPALAVSLGRMLAGPDPRRVLRTALWS